MTNSHHLFASVIRSSPQICLFLLTHMKLNKCFIQAFLIPSPGRSPSLKTFTSPWRLKSFHNDNEKDFLSYLCPIKYFIYWISHENCTRTWALCWLWALRSVGGWGWEGWGTEVEGKFKFNLTIILDWEVCWVGIYVLDNEQLKKPGPQGTFYEMKIHDRYRSGFRH